MSRRVLVALGLAGLVVGVSGEWVYAQSGAALDDVVRDVAVGWGFLGAGLAAWWWRPANHLGRLMTAEGFSWFIACLQGSGVPLLFAVGFWLSSLYRAIFVHLILAFPSGRLSSRWERAVTGTGYAISVVVGFLRVATYDPSKYCRGCLVDVLFIDTSTANPLLLYGDAAVFEGLNRVAEIPTFVMSAAIVGIVVGRWRSSSRPARRALAPVWVSVAVLTEAAVWGAVEASGMPSPGASAAEDWVGSAGLLAVPVAFLAGVLRARLAQVRVGELVVELGRTPSPGRLRDALARALKDPSLQVAFRASDTQGYVDVEGEPVHVPDQGSGRAVTLVERDGVPLAAMIHDPALVDERELVHVVATAARLGLENERLHAQARAQLAEVRASRARIVSAGDTARRRLERDLHDGAQQRLVSLSLRLGLARAQLGPDAAPELRASLAQANEELQAALAELRQLARGIHPAILTQQGLAGAVEELAHQAPLPVEVAVSRQRYSPTVEAAAYFVVCEALTNVTKHAQATAARITIEQSRGRLIVEVADDGGGGADPGSGSGLGGLADRMAALGGVLHIDSPAGRGTRVRAELPCD